MQHLIADLRQAFRFLRKSPGFTAVAVFTLAIGIAASSTVFSWIDGVLLHPIPGAIDSDRLAVLENVTPDGEFLRCSYPDYRDYRDSLTRVSGLAAIFGTTLRVGEGSLGREVWGELVTGNYFDVLGMKPALGRFFLPGEAGDPPLSAPVVVVSHRYWTTHLNGDPGAIGRTLRINRRTLTIIGVTQPEFQGTMIGVIHDMWIPLTLITDLNRSGPGMLENRWTRNQVLLARLAPGVSMEEARAEVAAVAGRLATAHPKSNESLAATILPLDQGHGGGAQSLLRRPLHVLLAVCGVLLLLVCANVGNLLLARATSRRKELAVRLAMGASRLQLGRHLFAETFLVAVAGGAVGLMLTPWLAGGLEWLLPPVNVPVRLGASVNWYVFAWTLGVCLLVTVLTGLAPLLATMRTDVNSTLKDSGRGGDSSAHSHRARGLLVITEVALCCVALIGAGLFLKSFQSARAIHPGFQTEGIAVARFHLADTGMALGQQNEFCRRLRQRLESSPGVAGAVYADFVPLGFDKGPWQDIQVEGYQPAKGENMKVYRNLVSPGYFQLLGIPLLEGRDFTSLDTREAPPVTIVTRTFARRFLSGTNPLGHKVRAWGRWFTVVGMVEDSAYHRVSGPREPYFYVPYEQTFSTGLTSAFFVRGVADPAAAIALMRREALAINPDADASEAMPMTEFIGQVLYPLKVAASLLSILGALAVLLAALGLYSVMTYAVATRIQEMGLRMALGAKSIHVLVLVLRHALLLTVAGLAAGLALALAASRLISTLLIEVRPDDPLTLAGAAALLVFVALLASGVPAFRATRVDPLTALRAQ